MAELRAQGPMVATSIAARSTTGQSLAIRYDPQTNTLTFVENDWFAEGFRSGLGHGESRLRPAIPARRPKLRRPS